MAMAAAARLSTADQLIRLFQASGKDPAYPEHTDGRWELHQQFRGFLCDVMLHPVRNRHSDQFTEGIQVRVKKNNLVEVFRETRDRHRYESHNETMITGVVPGLFAALDADYSFMQSLQNNAGFRAVLAKFDASGGRVPMANRERFLQLQRSAAARAGIARQLEEFEIDDDVADTVFKGVVDHAGSGRARCAFIDACL